MSRLRARLVTRNKSTNSAPPTAIRATFGVISAERFFNNNTASAPKKAAARNTAPRFCGSEI